MQEPAGKDFAGISSFLRIFLCAVAVFLLDLKLCSEFYLFQVEESSTEEAEVRSLPYVMVLHAFCVVDPTLLAPASDPSQFVVTLHPYLKSQVIDTSLWSLIFTSHFIFSYHENVWVATVRVRMLNEFYSENMVLQLKHWTEINKSSFARRYLPPLLIDTL